MTSVRPAVDALFDALLSSAQPSVYFRALADAGLLEGFLPELAAAIGVEQNPKYHPEGDVFVHTMCVVDAAAALRDRASDARAFMLAALFHDLGKIVATQVQEDGRITAYGHDVQGLPLIDAAMRRLTEDEVLIETVKNHTWLHMRPNMLRAANSKKRKTRELFRLSVCPNDLILLSRADASGQALGPYDEACELWLRERLKDYEARMAVPHLTDAELLDLCGVTQAQLERFSERAVRLHLSGLDRHAVASQIRREAQSERARA